MEKVIRNGKVAVLYSPGYGAGWYTWNNSHPECLFHPEIVALVEKGQTPDDRLCKTLFGDGFYCGGASDLKIKWLPVGTKFKINEYDGSESVQTIDTTDWETA